MGWHEIYEFLKSKPDRWFSNSQIATGIGVDPSCVCNTMKRRIDCLPFEIRKKRVYSESCRKLVFRFMFCEVLL